MSYRPRIADLELASGNEKDGLYEFKMKLVDGTKCRIFYSRSPEWKLTHISRLQKTPCPVCRKDFICKCMDQWATDLHQQMIDDQWIEKAIAE
ncbi:hypothetical protein C0Q44_15700 [Paenibacillus sp. PCH8]|uniref:hypothetical protein n=1 Tax=Paenibacillus sp. PCH8 TaxID=2066524 RepID=UPI000CFA6F80|nr:hypothetical protein [Paenibacillus sp. PCH8]PQP82827.1 hypothetical protein C0Q44_15700 [Paenibacillus sp. PCH8]